MSNLKFRDMDAGNRPLSLGFSSVRLTNEKGSLLGAFSHVRLRVVSSGSLLVLGAVEKLLFVSDQFFRFLERPIIVAA